MPDSFPPSGWGPAPFDEWDLDALLSGDTADTPPALRQVADALVALRAAPTPAELAGEAMIMAEFGALAGFSARGFSEATRADGQAHTLVLPVPPSDAPRRRGARHRSRRPARPLSWRAGALIGAAAAAVIVTVVAFPGLPGPIKSLAHLSTSSPSAGHPTGGSSGSQNVAAKSAAPERTPQGHPASSQPATAPQPTPSTLCRTFFNDFKHSGPHSKWDEESSLFWQISKLAGGPAHVFTYCAHYVQDPWNIPNGHGPQGKASTAQGPSGQQPGQSTAKANPPGPPAPAQS